MLVAVFVAAASCRGAGGPTVPNVAAPLPVPKISPVPSARQDPALCRVELVPSPPPDSVRVGTASVLQVTGTQVVLDSDARQTACELGATHAVLEQAYVDQSGTRRVTVGLYQLDALPQAPAPNTLFPRDPSQGPIGPGQPDLPDPLAQVPRPPPER